MLKAILIVATLFVASEGLKCNKCFYMEGKDLPDLTGREIAGFRYSDSCDWKEDVDSRYGGVECPRIQNVDPVCLTWRVEGDKIDIVLRGCYNQRGGVTEDELESCKTKGFLEFSLGTTLNPEILRFLGSPVPTALSNQTSIKQIEGDPESDVCLCKDKDNCNSGASAITVSFVMIAAVGSLLYSIN